MSDKTNQPPKTYAKNFVGTPANIELLHQSLRKHALPDSRRKPIADAIEKKLGIK